MESKDNNKIRKLEFVAKSQFLYIFDSDFIYVLIRSKGALKVYILKMNIIFFCLFIPIVIRLID